MNCKFCNEPIEKNDQDGKWYSAGTQQLHYWDCKSPNAPRLQGKKGKVQESFQKKPIVSNETILTKIDGIIREISDPDSELTLRQELNKQAESLKQIWEWIAKQSFAKASGDKLE